MPSSSPKSRSFPASAWRVSRPRCSSAARPRAGPAGPAWGGASLLVGASCARLRSSSCRARDAGKRMVLDAAARAAGRRRQRWPAGRPGRPRPSPRCARPAPPTSRAAASTSSPTGVVEAGRRSAWSVWKARASSSRLFNSEGAIMDVGRSNRHSDRRSRSPSSCSIRHPAHRAARPVDHRQDRGRRHRMMQLVAMRLRKVPPPLIVTARINALKAGLNITTDQLEAHYLAGGHVEPGRQRAHLAPTRPASSSTSTAPPPSTSPAATSSRPCR